MPNNSKSRTRLQPDQRKHRFFLSPYQGMAFTKCPKCDNKTKLRKIPLAIHVEPLQLVVINKECKPSKD